MPETEVVVRVNTVIMLATLPSARTSASWFELAAVPLPMPTPVAVTGIVLPNVAGATGVYEVIAAPAVPAVTAMMLESDTFSVNPVGTLTVLPEFSFKTPSPTRIANQ